MAIQGLKNLFFKDEVVFSFMSAFTGYNCPRRGYHWCYLLYMWSSDEHRKELFPFATTTSSFEEILSISIPSPLSSEEELIIQQWPDICMCLSKCKVFGAYVAACDKWWILKCTQALELTQEVFVTAHLARHWQDPCWPSAGCRRPICGSGSSPSCKKGPGSSKFFFFFLPWCCIWEHGLSLVLAHSAGAILPPHSQKDKGTGRFLLY